MTPKDDDFSATKVVSGSTASDPAVDGAVYDPSHVVQVNLRCAWYSDAMEAISDRGRDDDLLNDLLVEVANALLDAHVQASANS